MRADGNASSIRVSSQAPTSWGASNCVAKPVLFPMACDQLNVIIFVHDYVNYGLSSKGTTCEDNMHHSIEVVFGFLRDALEFPNNCVSVLKVSEIDSNHMPCQSRLHRQVGGWDLRVARQIRLRLDFRSVRMLKIRGESCGFYGLRKMFSRGICLWTGSDSFI